MKTDHPADFWRRKARALLMPSPFSPGSADHGKDEIERRARLEDIFRSTNQDDRSLIERCARDAHDAHVPGDVQERGLTWCKRWHPLIVGERTSDRELETDTPAQWFKHEEALRKQAAELAQAADAKGAYFTLWQEAMKRGDKMPGSFALPDHSVAALRSMTAALVGARADGCRAALLYVHIGPVQGFITASRRTHDLWVGSYTVGYLAMQAILAIAEVEGPDAIVYPDLAMLPLTKKLLFAASPKPEDTLRSSLANRFLAMVALERVDELLDSIHERVAGTWKDMARQAREGIRNPSPGDMWSGFDEQIDGHLELDAVVQPWPADRDALIALLERFPVSDRPSVPDPSDPERTGAGYGALFDLCHRTLTAYRKTTLPPTRSGDERPKCSQCGQREQMVPLINAQSGSRPLDRCRAHNEKLSQALSAEGSDDEGRRISYQLARGEGLCGVCWTKRMAPEEFFGADAGKLGLSWQRESDRSHLRFPGVVTIAAAPFRYRLLNPPEGFWDGKPEQSHTPLMLPSSVQTWLDKLDDVLAEGMLDFTRPGNLLYGLKEEDRDTRLRHVAAGVRAHDGEWLYDSNYEPETAWANHFAHDAGQDNDSRYELLKPALGRAHNAFVAMRQLVEIEASPYYAVLVLDGDDMGKWLTGRHPETPRLAKMLADTELARQVAADARPLYPALHRELARRLATLAIRLHEIVDEHLGRMVYSGGDDVMAFLPLATALPCARAIEHAMRDELGDKVTASAGLAVAHMRMPLSRTLDDARRAENQSKALGKDRLTVSVAKRSGAPVDVTIPWRVSKLHVDDEPDVIQVIIELLRRDGQGDESSRPLSRVDVVYRLEQEFRLLHGDGGHPEDSEVPSIAEMFFERTRTLLRKGIDGTARKRVDRLLDCLKKPLGSQACMNLLLLLRFLMREEHGIDTVTFLQDLGVWPWPKQEKSK